MEWNNYVVKLNVKSKEYDFNHPLNTFNTMASSGTGFFISNRLILTCYHVVKYAINIEVVYKQSTNVNATIKHIFPDDDLAIIILEKPIDGSKFLDFKVIPNTQVGNVHTIGYPMGSTTIKVTKGIVSGFEGSLIQTDATINPGNSGGPLVIKENEKYYVIGVNVSKLSGKLTEGTSYVVPIYRFIILTKSINTNSPIIIRKPELLFDFQKLIQDKLRMHVFKNYPKLIKQDIGARITKINPRYYLNQKLNEKDVILSINGCDVDSQGNVKFLFFPEKIPLDDIGLWFVPGDMIQVVVLDRKSQQIITKEIKLELIETNCFGFHGLSNSPSYFTENNGLIFSMITQEHIKQIKKLELSFPDFIRIIQANLNQRDEFIVYLADLNYAQLKNGFIKYPVGQIIVEINDKKFSNYGEYMEIMKEKVFKIKTMNNKEYYLDTPKPEKLVSKLRKYMVIYKN